LVTAALVRLLSLLSPLCPLVLSSFDFLCFWDERAEKVMGMPILSSFCFFTESFSLLSFSVYYFFLWVFFFLLLFWLQSCLCSCSVFGLIFPSLFCIFFWVDFCLLHSGFSSPFYREACSSTSPAFARLLLEATNEIVGKRRGPWSDLLQIISSPAESGFPLLNRDGEDARLFLSNGAVSAEKWKFSIWPLPLKI
jgi:hypothetical protein